jgi:hypothetical protein
MINFWLIGLTVSARAREPLISLEEKIIDTGLPRNFEGYEVAARASVGIASGRTGEVAGLKPNAYPGSAINRRQAASTAVPDQPEASR